MMRGKRESLWVATTITIKDESERYGLDCRQQVVSLLAWPCLTMLVVARVMYSMWVLVEDILRGGALLVTLCSGVKPRAFDDSYQNTVDLTCSKTGAAVG